MRIQPFAIIVGNACFNLEVDLVDDGSRARLYIHTRLDSMVNATPSDSNMT